MHGFREQTAKLPFSGALFQRRSKGFKGAPKACHAVEDITEKIDTHRRIEYLHRELQKIK